MKWTAIVLLLLSVLSAVLASCGVDYSPLPHPYYDYLDQCTGEFSALYTEYEDTEYFCCVSQKLEDCSLESQFLPCSDPASSEFTQDGSNYVILAAFETSFSMVSYNTIPLFPTEFYYYHYVETLTFSPTVFLGFLFSHSADVEVYAGGKKIATFEDTDSVETELELASRDISSLEVRYSACGQSGVVTIPIHWSEPYWYFDDYTSCGDEERYLVFDFDGSPECDSEAIEYELIIPDLDYTESFQSSNCFFDRNLFDINPSVPSDIIVNIFNLESGRNYTTRKQFNIVPTSYDIEIYQLDYIEGCSGETHVFPLQVDLYRGDWTVIELCNSASGQCAPVIDGYTVLSFEILSIPYGVYPVTAVLEHCSGTQHRMDTLIYIETDCTPFPDYYLAQVMITEDQGIYIYGMEDKVPGILTVDGKEFPLAKAGAGLVSKNSVVSIATHMEARSDVRFSTLEDISGIYDAQPQLVTYFNGTHDILGYEVESFETILMSFTPHPLSSDEGSYILAPGEYTMTLLHGDSGQVMKIKLNLKDEWPRPTVQISGDCEIDECTNTKVEFTFTYLVNVEYRVRTSSSDPSWETTNTVSVDIDPSVDILLIAEYRINEEEVRSFEFNIPRRQEVSLDSLEVSALVDLDSCSITVDAGNAWNYHYTLSLELNYQSIDFTEKSTTIPIQALGDSLIIGNGKISFGYSAVLKNPCGNLDELVKNSSVITVAAPVSTPNIQIESLFSDDCSEYFGTRISWDPIPGAVVDAFIGIPIEGIMTTDIRSVKGNSSAIVNAKTMDVINLEDEPIPYVIGVVVHAPCGIQIPAVQVTSKDELLKCVPKPPSSSSSSQSSEGERSEVSGASQWIIGPLVVVACVLALL